MTDEADTEGRVAPLIGLFLGPLLLLALLLMPAPEGLTPEAWTVAAVVALMVTWWITEALPVAATALLLSIAYAVRFGVLSWLRRAHRRDADFADWEPPPAPPRRRSGKPPDHAPHQPG